MSIAVAMRRYETSNVEVCVHTRHNRTIAYGLALIGLLAILAVRQRVTPVGFEDYSVYYLGGTMVLQGAWHDLYPVPLPGAASHPGWPAGSIMKPAYQQAAARMGQHEPYRYVYPPPSAVLISPLSALRPEAALRLWWALSAVACWASALYAAAIYRRLTGRRDLMWTLLLFGITWCPLTWATVRVGNTSAITGALVSVVLYGWCTGNRVSSALALYGAAALKFVTLPLTLIPVLLRRTTDVIVSALVAGALTAGVMALSGIDPWLEYLRLFSSLNRSNGWVINVSLRGLIEKLFPAPGQPALLTLQIITWLALGVIAFGLHRCAWRRNDPRPVLAAASALLAWLLVFGPTTQNHYFVYLYPLWGYYLAESRTSWLGRIAALCVIGGTMIPLGGSNRALPVWLHFHQLAAATVAMVFGTIRLYQLGAGADAGMLASEHALIETDRVGVAGSSGSAPVII